MTDPERISRRPTGLSGELLRAGLEEQPSSASVERTLVALGVSGALVTSGVAAQAAASGVKLGSAVTGGAVTGGAVAVKAMSATLLVKWIGIGVVSGVGLAGAASVASEPAVPEPSIVTTLRRPAPKPAPLAPPAAMAKGPEAPVVPSPSTRPSARAESPPLSLPRSADGAVGAPLAAEVALIDEARDALAAGRSERALALLTRHEREFPEARLLPEALFLTLEASERLGRRGEAVRAAEQLLRGFPRSPHAARARKALER